MKSDKQDLVNTKLYSHKRYIYVNIVYYEAFQALVNDSIRDQLRLSQQVQAQYAEKFEMHSVSIREVFRGFSYVDLSSAYATTAIMTRPEPQTL
jgi:DNA mismatch repair ATPase MutS